MYMSIKNTSLALHYLTLLLAANATFIQPVSGEEYDLHELADTALRDEAEFLRQFEIIFNEIHGGKEEIP